MKTYELSKGRPGWGDRKAHMASARVGGAGRTLALIDVENLLGGTVFTPQAVAKLRGAFEGLGIWRPDVQPVVAASAMLPLVHAFMGWPTARMMWRPGRDGADLCLLDVLQERIPQRYDHVLIGSGDGILALPARSLRRHGVRVTVALGLGICLMYCAESQMTTSNSSRRIAS